MLWLYQIKLCHFLPNKLVFTVLWKLDLFSSFLTPMIIPRGSIKLFSILLCISHCFIFIFFACKGMVIFLKPRANGCNIVGSYMFHSFAHPVACCWELLHKVWNWSNFWANNPQHFFCSVITEVWHNTVGSICTALQHCLGHACALHVVSMVIEMH